MRLLLLLTAALSFQCLTASAGVVYKTNSVTSSSSGTGWYLEGTGSPPPNAFVYGDAFGGGETALDLQNPSTSTDALSFYATPFGNGSYDAFTVSSGDTISTLSTTGSQEWSTYQSSNQSVFFSEGGSATGNLSIGSTGYIAFRFSDGSNLLYGWANVTLALASSLVVNEWAYADSAEDSAVLKVGSTSTTSTVPEPSSVVILASVCVAGFCRRKRA